MYLNCFQLILRTAMCSSKKYSSPHPHGGQRKFRGVGGGSKRRQFPSGRGVAYRGFFPGGLSKIGELLINTSFSAEQAFSYFTVSGPPNKYCCLHCIDHLLPTVGQMLFLTAYAIVFLNTIVICWWINFQLSSCCCITHLIHRNWSCSKPSSNMFSLME